ncbi:universal stress protein [Zunongwangia sp. H14]|uniref:universal stress protein n=1 Tax=Zunongwangia sp. H14 TaxID=3240792 RepID=UPI0035690779
MEKRILVPTNFSKHAWNALVYGFGLYKNIPCTFYVLNAYQSGSTLPEKLSLSKSSGKNATERAREDSLEGLEKVLQGLSFRKENPRHQFETLSSNQPLPEAIQDAVDKHNIDLILMGSKGENVSINSAYDNTVTLVSDKIEKCPILVIPEECSPTTDLVREIVFPTSFRMAFKLKELTALMDIASSFRAGIRVLYIDTDNKKLNKEQESNKKVLKDYFIKFDCSFHTLTKTTISTGTRLFIESRQSDLLAIYKRKQGFFSKLFAQPFIEEIDFNPNIPVLVLKEND